MFHNRNTTQFAKDEIDAIRLKIIDQYNYLFAILFFINIAFELYFKQIGITLYVSLIIFICSIGLFFSKLKYNRYFLAGLIFIFSVLVFSFSKNQPVEYLIGLYYFPLLLSIPLVFDVKKDKYFVLSLLIILSLELIDIYFLNNKSLQTEKNKNQIIFEVQIKNLFNVAVFTIIPIYFIFQKQNLIIQLYNDLIEKKTMVTKLTLQINEAFEELVNLAKKNDPTFLTRFQEVYPDFCPKLLEIQPNLTQGDLKFCAMLKFNFSSKEIANYTFVTLRATQQRKGKLRKVLSISSETDIYQWINNL